MPRRPSVGIERPFIVTGATFTPALPADRRGGFIGFAAATINGRLRLESMTVHRTLDGRLTLSFPAKRGGRRTRHFFYRPISNAARRELEHAILQAIRHRLPPASGGVA